MEMKIQAYSIFIYSFTRNSSKKYFKNRDNNGFVYFNELLFKTMRKIYGTSAFKSSDLKIINEMKRLEYRTKRQLALKVNHKNQPPFYSVSLKT